MSYFSSNKKKDEDFKNESFEDLSEDLDKQRIENEIRKDTYFMHKDVQTIKAIQHHLDVALHAKLCNLVNENKYLKNVCTIDLCPTMKAVLKHIKICEKKDCEKAHCVSTKNILTHFTRCKLTFCDICEPNKDYKHFTLDDFFINSLD